MLILRLVITTVLLLSPLAPLRAAEVTGAITVPPGRTPEDSVVYLLNPSKPSAPATGSATLEQRLMHFVPRVLVVQRGTRVLFPNTDVVRHSIFSPSRSNRFSLGLYPPGSSREQTFEKAGLVSLLCNVHPDEAGFIVVVDSPYFTRTGADGVFSIRNVPPGRYELVVWHEGLPESRQPLEVQGAVVRSSVQLRKAE